tara:strand:- start:233 stop:571 length:339 start_codon:yes stop_codon:yes gene_type:complete
MNKFFKLSILIATSLIIVSCINSRKEGLEPNVNDPNLVEPKKGKEIKTIFIPIGGFTSGFIYCGFDGEKSMLQELTSEGWEIKNIIPQNFETTKRNGDIVVCNGSNYILERS